MRKQGNLFLVDGPGTDEALIGLATQQRLGCDSVWLDASTIAEKFPALESDQIVGGTFGPTDGTVDVNAVVAGYRRKSIAAGARLLPMTVEALAGERDRITTLRLSDGSVMEADSVVVCAGAWSADLLATCGVEIPVEPVMRTVYTVAGGVPGSEGMPNIFLPSGIYVFSEHHGVFTMAWSTDEDPVGFDFTPASRSRFYKIENNIKEARLSTLQKIIELGLGGHLELSIKL
jgi:glycine/D-amino acid oxidase-like deaminating enzyme